MAYQAKTRKSFLVYHQEMQEAARLLSAEEFRTAYLIICTYSETGELPEAYRDLSGYTSGLQLFVSQQLRLIDGQAERYEETCERNRRNRAQGRSAVAVDRSSSETTTGDQYNTTQINSKQYNSTQPNARAGAATTGESTRKPFVPTVPAQMYEQRPYQATTDWSEQYMKLKDELTQKYGPM